MGGSSLNQLLQESNLTELEIVAKTLDTTTLVLPAGRLRKFSLRLYESHTRGNELLTAENADRLAEGGCLHSLCLRHLWGPVVSPDYLRKFTALSYFNTQITGANSSSLASATAHLPYLRALELEEIGHYGDPPVNWSEVVRLLTPSRPELRHLALRTGNNERELMAAVGQGSALLSMEQLVSLEIRYWNSPSSGNWALLEELAERGRLEHLVVEPAQVYQGSSFSEGLLCRMIKNCKVNHPSFDFLILEYSGIFQRLRYLRTSTTKFYRDDCSRLARAASSTDSQEARTLPILCLYGKTGLVSSPPIHPHHSHAPVTVCLI